MLVQESLLISHLIFFNYLSVVIFKKSLVKTLASKNLRSCDVFQIY